MTPPPIAPAATPEATSHEAASHETLSYETDYYGWLQQQADLLRSGRFAELDLDNVLEELASLGRSEKRALMNQMRPLYLHLLKWHYQPTRRSRSWAISIGDAQDAISDLLSDNPSFQANLGETVAQAYAKARRVGARETGLPIDTFPPEPPFTWAEAMQFEVQ